MSNTRIHATQRPGRGRHVNRAAMAGVTYWTLIFAAFTIALVALSAGLILLIDAGVDAVAVAPALALVFSAGAAFALMIVATNRHTE